MNRLQPGTWGGAHIGVEITEHGARLNYDCAHGTIDEPISPDQGGRFVANGTHAKERGGPLRRGDENDGQPAHYTGTVAGQKMTLTVTLTDTQEVVGTYTVTRGQRPRIVKCM